MQKNVVTVYIALVGLLQNPCQNNVELLNNIQCWLKYGATPTFPALKSLFPV